MIARIFFFFILFLFLLTAVFNKGLFFDHDFYSVQLIIFIVFIITYIYFALQKKLTLYRYHFLILLLPIVLALSSFQAVTPLGAIHELLRWTAYSCFFMLVSLYSENMGKQSLAYILTGTGFILAIASLAGYFDIFPLQDGVVAGRLAGPLQYPNTCAVLLGMLLLFQLSLLVGNVQTKANALYHGYPIIALFTSLLFTESKGVLLLLPVAWYVGLLLLKVEQRPLYLFYSVLSLIFSSGLYFVTSPIIFFIGLLSFSGIYVWIVLKKEQLSKGRKAFERISPKKSVACLLYLFLPLLFILFLLDIAFQGLVYSMLPITISLDTFTERLIIARDALVASKDAFWLGYGGSGWSVIYTKYQSLPYQTNSIHNGYMEWLINTGIVGFLLFIGVFGFYFYKLFQSRKKDSEEMRLGVIVALLLVFLHSVIDFNFSFGVIWFYVLLLFAMGLPLETNVINKRSFLRIALLFQAVVVLIGLMYSYRFMKSNEVYQQVSTVKNIAMQEEYVQTAIENNPYDIEKWNTLGKLRVKQSTEINPSIVNVIEEMNNLEPYSAQVHFYSIQLLEAIGRLEEASIIAKQGISSDRYSTVLRNKELQLKTDLAVYLHQAGKGEEAKLKANEALSSYILYEQEVKNVKEKLPNTHFNSRQFDITRSAQFSAALSAYLIKKDEKVLDLLGEIRKNQQDVQNNSEAALAYVTNQSLGNHEAAKSIWDAYEINAQFVSLVEELKLIRN
ncbi:O-antigen ligase family protein [Bacillus sp. 2205SS5-2]|uniref:O-antigen ligase family protein n=1 Tax=Bacillus sp. 2205SS5-2 TaxID=3109031 RepID=UPI0030073A0B